MSAYGTILRPAGARPLSPRSYPINAPTTAPGVQPFLTIVPVKRETISDSLFTHLNALFNAVVAEGRTYPYEELLSGESFENYYFSYDCFVGILDPDFVLPTTSVTAESSHAEEGFERDASLTIESLRKGREWGQCVAGLYYIKPNYPGRSSHCCNAGFVIDPRHRGMKLGLTLGKSYLHFAPQLGYLASVFNLVYANNIASLRIWDQLGFTRAGLIPRAGRLKNAASPEEEEEFVDAVVYWRSLVPDETWESRLAKKA